MVVLEGRAKDNINDYMDGFAATQRQSAGQLLTDYDANIHSHISELSLRQHDLAKQHDTYMHRADRESELLHRRR